MATSAEKLLKLKDEITQAKLDKAKIEGALKQNLQRLKDEFGCRSLEQAKTKLKQLQQKKEDLQIKLDETVKELEEKYSW